MSLLGKWTNKQFYLYCNTVYLLLLLCVIYLFNIVRAITTFSCLLQMSSLFITIAFGGLCDNGVFRSSDSQHCLSRLNITSVIVGIVATSAIIACVMMNLWKKTVVRGVVSRKKHTHAHIRAHMHAYTHIHAHIHAHMHAHIRAHIHIHAHIRAYIHAAYAQHTRAWAFAFFTHLRTQKHISIRTLASSNTLHFFILIWFF